MTTNGLRDSSILLLGTQMAVGGAQRILLTLAQWLCARGWRVVVAFLYDRDGLAEQWRMSLQQKGNESGVKGQDSSLVLVNLRFRQRERQRLRLLDFLGGVFRLYRLMREEQPAVVMTFTHHSNLVGIPLAWLADVPLRIASHLGQINRFPRWLERLHAWLINSRLTSCLAVNSAQVRDRAVNAESIHTDKVVVIPNGVGPGSFSWGTVVSGPSARLTRLEWRQRHDIPVQALVLATIGRLTEQKGQGYLIDALPAIRDRFPQVHVLFVGEGDMREVLEIRAAKLGVKQVCHFLGWRGDAEVAEILDAADIFVLPSISEGMPVALLEALRAGLPSVVSGLDCVKEIIHQGETGLLVPPGDSAQLAKAIIELAEDAALRSRLGNAAKELVEREYTVERMCERYEQLFKQYSQ